MAAGSIAFLGAGKAPKIHFQIILKDISKLELVKQGFGKYFLATTIDGTKYKFAVVKREPWIKAFSDAGIKVEGA